MNSETGLSAVILAGGRGTRISEIYPDIPKPLVPAAGTPFLHWIVSWLQRQGASRVILSIGYLADAIDQWAQQYGQTGNQVLVCRREIKALGTGGGVRNCLDLCHEQVLICNGDSLVAAELSPHFQLLTSTQIEGIVFAVEVDDASRYGTLHVGPDGRLLEFAEKRPGKGLVNAGIYLLKRKLLEGFPADTMLSMETDVIPKLIAEQHHIEVVSLGACDFLDIGTPTSVHQATDFITRNKALFM